MTWIPVAISLGAALGALSRYYTTLFWVLKRGQAFPYGTLFVNLSGSLLIGILAATATQNLLPMAVQKLVMTGFLGAYTTFSSYILDSAYLFRSRSPYWAIFYWLGSPLLGFFCVKIGIVLGERLW